MLLDRIPVRLRLSLGHAIWMALLFLGIGIGIYRYVENNLFQSVDAALLTSARSIRDARFVKGFSSPLMQEFLEEFLGERFIRPYAQLVDLSGRVSVKSENSRATLPVTPLAVNRAERGLVTFESFHRVGQSKIRQITLPVMKRGRFSGELIQVGAALDSTEHTLSGISLMLWVALPMSLLLSVVFGYLLTARSLRPVTAISQAAAGMGLEDLSTRLALPRAKDEIRGLTQTFNGMLERLEDAFVRLRRFAGDVSHELRTPLTVLRGEAEFALRRERSPDDYRQALRTIVKEAVHMTDIVEDLLLLARAQGKSIKIDREWVAIDRFVLDLVQLTTSTFRDRVVTLEPRIFAHGPIKISSGYLGLAIKNILLNAAKHSPRDSVVYLEVTQDSRQTLFTIRDTGEGIPATDLPYIFDPFYRADTARNRAAGGSGIGLSLAQALVQLHGGQISVASTEGKGASFTVRLPNQPAESESHPNGRSSGRSMVRKDAAKVERSPALPAAQPLSSPNVGLAP